MMRIFPGFWQRHFLRYEMIVVIVLGIAGVIYGYQYGGNQVIDGYLDGNRERIYNALASIFASLFGFVIAATSIIVGLLKNPRFTVVKESDGYKDLWRTLFSTIRWLGMATLVALGALVVDRQDSPVIWMTHAVLILTVLVVVRLWRCVWVLEETIKLASRRSKGRTADDQADAAKAESTSV